MDQIRGLICILGPTASGKTSLAVALAKKINGAIISADSRQVFRGMDIGTGKDLAEYEGVDYYLIDIRDAGADYHVAHFQDDFQEALLKIQAQGKIPILCGGTGLYIQSVLQHYMFTAIPRNDSLRFHLLEKDMEELEKLFLSMPQPTTFKADISTKKRLIRAIEIASWLKDNPQAVVKQPQKPAALVFGIQLSLDDRRARITQRLEKRLAAGLIDEVKRLMDAGVSADKLKFYGLEYKYVTAFLLGEMDRQQLFTKLNTEIHRFAKRQMTYFRKMEKDGIHIHWLDGTDFVAENVEKIIGYLL
ncbi:tRNA (adenosine(37)-N6)-dimethylallyltransferase MiaA [Olivibacter sp. XZL3]|uniref:tRNA (adenosine(37)-N6)-dimethylallyltransferase MiaA n=1 Tax=Olivibacter sp. XZL3 TaxID=1735116 RepID=UPI001066B984|nr:tRNA (adenosine(37)-N6)-dimethylallyltransferase MiaA [Olivibacter sp. XZL3]